MGINNCPLHKAPQLLTASLFFLCIGYLFPLLLSILPSFWLRVPVSAWVHLWAGNPSLPLPSSPLPTLDPSSLGINLIIFFWYAQKINEPGEREHVFKMAQMYPISPDFCWLGKVREEGVTKREMWEQQIPTKMWWPRPLRNIQWKGKQEGSSKTTCYSLLRHALQKGKVRPRQGQGLMQNYTKGSWVRLGPKFLSSQSGALPMTPSSVSTCKSHIPFTLEKVYRED